MIYTLQNEFLTVKISDLGAELQSIADAEGRERLWQGDEAFWGERAPFMFPFCGRVWNGLVTANGVPCKIDLHGFFRHRLTEAQQVSSTEISFVQADGEDTLADYPFHFRVRITYLLEGNRITVRGEVTNTGDRVMPYGFGAHPGFCAPFDGGCFEDYYVEFPHASGARALCFDENNCFLIGGTKDFPMRDGVRFDLTDDFFATGSSFLCDMPEEVTLKNDRSNHYLKLRYAGIPYLGLWKVPGADYVCIEPWCSLPAYSGESTELYEKEDLCRVAPGMTDLHEFSIEIG